MLIFSKVPARAEDTLWGAGKKPGRYDAAHVTGGRGKRDRRRAAVMWLYVVRLPREYAGSDGINLCDLKK